MRPWVGVDLDGTLAFYDYFRGAGHIGEPIPEMLARVQYMIERDIQVKIMTARVGQQRDPDQIKIARTAIIKWCVKHIGVAIPVTCEKDYGMVRLWDDRCVTVEKNTGRILTKGIEDG